MKKKTGQPTATKILLGNELLTFIQNFMQIYNLETIKNLLPTPSFAKIQNKLV